MSEDVDYYDLAVKLNHYNNLLAVWNGKEYTLSSAYSHAVYLNGISKDGAVGKYYEEVKIYLRPLNEIPSNFFKNSPYPLPRGDIYFSKGLLVHWVPSGVADKVNNFHRDLLIMHHYDVFGLIEKGYVHNLVEYNKQKELQC